MNFKSTLVGECLLTLKKTGVFAKFCFAILFTFFSFLANAQVDSLSITKTIATVPAKPGDPVVYQIIYSNLNISRTANNIVIKDTLPSAGLFTYVTSTGAFDNPSRTITWSNLSLAAGTSGTLTISGISGKAGGPTGIYAPASYYIYNG